MDPPIGSASLGVMPRNYVCPPLTDLVRRNEKSRDGISDGAAQLGGAGETTVHDSPSPAPIERDAQLLGAFGRTVITGAGSTRFLA